MTSATLAGMAALATTFNNCKLNLQSESLKTFGVWVSSCDAHLSRTPLCHLCGLLPASLQHPGNAEEPKVRDDHFTIVVEDVLRLEILVKDALGMEVAHAL